MENTEILITLIWYYSQLWSISVTLCGRRSPIWHWQWHLALAVAFGMWWRIDAVSDSASGAFKWKRRNFFIHSIPYLDCCHYVSDIFFHVDDEKQNREKKKLRKSQCLWGIFFLLSLPCEWVTITPDNCDDVMLACAFSSAIKTINVDEKKYQRQTNCQYSNKWNVQFSALCNCTHGTYIDCQLAHTQLSRTLFLARTHTWCVPVHELKLGSIQSSRRSNRGENKIIVLSGCQHQLTVPFKAWNGRRQYYYW